MDTARSGSFPKIVLTDKMHSELLLNSLLRVFSKAEGTSNSSFAPEHPDFEITIGSGEYEDKITLVSAPNFYSSSGLDQDLYSTGDGDPMPALLSYIFYLYYGINTLSDAEFESAYYSTTGMMELLKYGSRRQINYEVRTVLKSLIPEVQKRFNSLPSASFPKSKLPAIP